MLRRTFGNWHCASKVFIKFTKDFVALKSYIRENLFGLSAEIFVNFTNFVVPVAKTGSKPFTKSFIKFMKSFVFISRKLLML